MTRSELQDLERRFVALLRHPTGVRDGLAALAGGDPAIAPLSSWIVGVDEDEAIRRLDVYANMYFYRLLDVLREDYPKTLARVGDDAFHNLVTDYLLVHPSTRPSVRHVGGAFAGFLATHALAEADPALPGLARLEWARTEVFDALDERPLTAEDVAALGIERFLATPLRRLVASRLVTLTHEVDGEAPGVVLVHRVDFSIERRAVAPDEADLLGRLEQGATFLELAERLAAGLPPEVAGARAQALLGQWVGERLLVAAR